MIKSLYDTLGVKSSDSKTTIKRAYRKLARKFHPDRNAGEDKDFKDVNLAYAVLSDDVMRERYDRTGEYDTITADNTSSEVMGVITQCFEAVMSECIGKSIDPATMDIVAKIMTFVIGCKAQIDLQRQSAVLARAAWDKVLGRFSVTSGENFMEETAKKHVRQFDERLAIIDRETAKFDQVVELLKKVKFRSEVILKLKMSQYYVVGGGTHFFDIS